MPDPAFGVPGAPALGDIVGIVIGVAGDAPPVPVVEDGDWSNAAAPLDGLQPSAPNAAMVATKRRNVFTQRQ